MGLFFIFGASISNLFPIVFFTIHFPMKKPILVLVVVGFVAVIFIATRGSKPAAKPDTASASNQVSTAQQKDKVSAETKGATASPASTKIVPTNPGDTAEIAALRKSLGAETHEGLEKAMNDLKAYIEAHPER